VPVLERVHLGGAAGLAAAFHDVGDLVVDLEEGERAAGRPPPLIFSRVERMVERSEPVPEPNLKSIASERARSMIDSMLSSTAWMKQALPWGYSYWVGGALGLAGLAVEEVVAPAALAADAVLVVEADVEPDGRVEGAVLVDAEPGQVVVEDLGVLLGLEVAVLDAPIGDGAGDAVDELATEVSRPPL
jgi:hypothetical protein